MKDWCGSGSGQDGWGWSHSVPATSAAPAAAAPDRKIRVALLALDEVGVGNTALAAPLSAALLGVQPAAVVGLGAGADTEMLDRKVVTVTAALRRVEDRDGDELLDPLLS
jgi:NaMN:DMB phosphoribosyltransferase